MSTDFEAEIMSVIERVHSDAREQTKQAINALIQQGIRSSNDLVAFLKDESTNIDTRVMVCWLLSRLNYEESVQTLLELIDDENPALRRAAIQALGEINVQRNHVVTSLIQCLQDDDVEVRKMTAYALGQIGAHEATAYLIRQLENQDELPEVRGMAAEALSMINDKNGCISIFWQKGINWRQISQVLSE